eukprot:Clim_evm52s142 gene=Clim_evmTU52s142
MAIRPELAQRLAEFYAPELRFDSREKYFPCSLEWLADNSAVWCKTGWDRHKKEYRRQQSDGSSSAIRKGGRRIDVQIAGVGELVDPVEASASECSLNEVDGQTALWHEHRLRPDSTMWEGQGEEDLSRGRVPCYASVSRAPCNIFDEDGCDIVCEDVYEITYYFIYAYNGNIFSFCGLGCPFEVGVHEGDLEQVVVFAKEPATDEDMNSLISVFYYRHAGEGRFVTNRSGLQLTQNIDGIPGCHPIVYPATESHASYSETGWTFRILGFANDLHNGKGRRWQCWKNVEVIDKEMGQPNWINFDGDYGTVEGLTRRGNLGRPGMSSRNCTLSPVLPTDPFRGRHHRAKKHIPRQLVAAVQKPNASSSG